MSRPTLRSALRPLISSPTPASSSTLPLSRPASTASAWPSKTHLSRRSTPTHPNPLPALYPKRVVLSDGSTFTAHLTAPSPATIRLTRDVTNNPIWAPGTEKRGLGEGAEEGRVGRFRRRFEGLSGEAEGLGDGEGEVAAESGEGGKKEPKKRAFAETDLEWMSEGAIEEKVGAGKPKGKR
ncbi:uncharacterized protein MKK02DRAFT_34129 [Dioszegia hungarica]|uniref:50S ribosomal protein L36 n=1 Tax=Dioszegia hungarica TaxID=4972 RepID=A0AA38HBE0_9TREE|nr:uncharacterized protein MKK02DRAFT_34129 [Dioszegia hungarica]KAI9637087.1 hypothetical protein MKK02DRAFT_34129 [Dioszegia hungarica]